VLGYELGRKLTYDEVKLEFKKRGYELLEDEYVGSMVKMHYKCPKHSDKTLYNSVTEIKQGYGCHHCSGRRIQYTYQEVKQYFTDNDCELLSKEFKSIKQKLKFKCHCGNIDDKSFEIFKRSNQCNHCGLQQVKSKLSYSYEEVYTYFESKGCILLSKIYNNNKQKLDYICSCGNKSQTIFDSFKRGHRCRECGKKKIQQKNSFDYEDIRKEFAEEGYELLSDTYVNRSQYLQFKCPEGHIGKITYSNFTKGTRCNKCSSHRRMSYEEVFKIFKENGCKLLENKYQGAHVKMKYVCSCGNTSETTLSLFMRGSRCRECGIKKLTESRRFSFDYVKQYFEDNGCTLLSDQYTNATEVLNYICSCGTISKIRFIDFKNGSRCRDCGIKKYSETKRYTVDEVRDYFSSKNCELLSKEYNGSLLPLKFKCKCGSVVEKSLARFKDNPKCSECTSKHLSSLRKGNKVYGRPGKLHPQWDHSKTYEEREQGRLFPEYKIWRNKVFERDDYTCQCCGDKKGGNLNAHHLDGYDWDIINRFSAHNGITLCDICHKDFHNIYGYGGNTREQYEEYINDLYTSII
jgi:hypothetical protein